MTWIQALKIWNKGKKKKWTIPKKGTQGHKEVKAIMVLETTT